jgi:RNA:NAD 2'-phosphotransferase (TPT1/KptA family)
MSLSDFESSFAQTRAQQRRFKLVDGLMRSMYTHSPPQRLLKERALRPSLCHETLESATHAITLNGLLPMVPQYVHLAVD